MSDFAAAFANENQPEDTLKALESLADETIGVRLFTMMEFDAARDVARRFYSNMPAAYPVSGEKPAQRGAWSEQVIDRREPFVANSHEEIAAVFPDHELIRSLGCESCLNLPVSIGGKVVGTLNCLHEAGHYTPARIAAAETLKLPGALAFLLVAHFRGA